MQEEGAEEVSVKTVTETQGRDGGTGGDQREDPGEDLGGG